jgi:hypothetical protein
MTTKQLTTQANTKANPAQASFDAMKGETKMTYHEKVIDLLVVFHGWKMVTQDKTLAYKEIAGNKFVAIFDIPYALSLSVYANDQLIADFISANYSPVSLAQEASQSATNYGV